MVDVILRLLISNVDLEKHKSVTLSRSHRKTNEKQVPTFYNFKKITPQRVA